MKVEIISGYDPEKVTQRINSKLAEGWELEGELSVIPLELFHISGYAYRAKYTQLLIKA